MLTFQSVFTSSPKGSFQTLPFDLCSAPRLFTKLLKPVAAFLAQTKDEVTRNTHLLVERLHSLGFTVNFTKSFLIPA